MIQFDKFGHKIYNKAYRILEKNGNILLNLGYRESSKNPNLFYLNTRLVRFFADMRGTEEVPIWQETKPLFYWEFLRNTYNWEKRRILKNELQRLYSAHCPCRLTFFLYNAPEFENTSIEIDVEKGIYNWDDGYCQACGKDFQDEGSFCSNECEDKYFTCDKTENNIKNNNE
ncbi:MAG: hypothetical protein R3F48_12600 [Candidatus Zixiibacteriota bacterium]